MTDTRTIVTVHPHPADGHSPVRYEAECFTISDGHLVVQRSGEAQGIAVMFGAAPVPVAAWVPGTWTRAEVSEEVPDFELREGEPVTPADPEQPAGPGTFEVYEDMAGKHRYRLKTANGEVIASSQAYTTRAGAQRATEVVQRAAKGAPIVDVDGDR